MAYSIFYPMRWATITLHPCASPLATQVSERTVAHQSNSVSPMALHEVSTRLSC